MSLIPASAVLSSDQVSQQRGCPCGEDRESRTLGETFLFITLVAKPSQTTQPHCDKAKGSSTITPHPTAAPCSGRGQRGSQRCHPLFLPPRNPARTVAACAALLFCLLIVAKLHFFLHRSNLILGFCFWWVNHPPYVPVISIFLSRLPWCSVVYPVLLVTEIS